MFLTPIPPPYDPIEWSKKPIGEKSKMVCHAWAMQGYGTPIAVYLVYLAKIAFYVWMWSWFCGFTPGMGGLATLTAWCFEPVAFQKAILWSMLFEILGLGCGSGPLTGRYMPPIGGFLYFLRPGTTKLPVFHGMPIIGGTRRSWLDVSLYALNAVCVLLALTSPTIDRRLIVAIAILLPTLGILDKTLFLAARAEHYWTTIVIFVLATNFLPGAKGVHAALWFWAGISKLNHHFPGVVGVMTSNNPFLRLRSLRRLMYRNFPDDMAPSRIASVMAHMGTAIELAVPVVLLSAHGGTPTIVGLVLMVVLHGFITSNVPMAVPLEWNVMMVYGGFFLFGKHADVSVLSASVPTLVVLLVMCVLVPLVGNLFPGRVPFLLAMRYYAGNWAYSVWLIKKGTHTKFERLTKSAPWVYDQMNRFYEPPVGIGLIGKVIAFRLMHLHGRALPTLVPKAVQQLEDYEWLDGELIAGMALGWNFGDGHLHNEQLLHAIQAQCAFEPGELRCVMVESQPLFKSTLAYRIHDANRGLMESGHVSVNDLRTRQPWGWVE